MDGIIVLMDYSEFDREKAKSTLGNAGGFAIVEITTADQYHELIKTIRGISLFIMDISFPTEKQGFEILSEIRNNPDTIRVPIIITSRSNNLEHRNAAALQFGVNDYIVKPYTAKRLGKSVQSLIKPAVNSPSYDIDNFGNITMSFDRFVEKELKFADRMKHPLSIIVFTPGEQLREQSMPGNTSIPSKDVLSQVCEKIRAALRTTDTVFLGTERDILIILPGTDGAGAQVVAERLKHAISLELEKSNIPGFEALFYSAGVTYPEDGKDFQSLLENVLKKASHKEMIRKISSIPPDTREYANKLYTKFRGIFF